MSKVVWCSPSKMSIPSLRKIFERGWYDVSLRDETTLVVQTETVKIFVSIDGVRRLVKYETVVSLDEDSPWQAKLELVNRLNVVAPMLRFYVSAESPSLMTVSYELSFECGISAHHLVQPLRTMATVVVCGLKEHDEDGVAA